MKQRLIQTQEHTQFMWSGRVYSFRMILTPDHKVPHLHKRVVIGERGGVSSAGIVVGHCKDADYNAVYWLVHKESDGKIVRARLIKPMEES